MKLVIFAVLAAALLLVAWLIRSKTTRNEVWRSAASGLGLRFHPESGIDD